MVQRYHHYQLMKREDGSLWELGRGAMGITYKAYDTNLRFTVALKVINSTYLDSETARQRFLREARAAAALRHPNVASVFNLGTEDDKYFYVMEFIDGETLESRVKRQGPLEPVEALNIGLQVSRALAVAAKQQLVHRDLKPTNLMLVDQEDEILVKVIDFGLAKAAKSSGEDSGALTVGGFVGTPHFASPEQIEEGAVDIRSDIYSLGVTLYFCLTGQAPFSGSVGQVMSQQLYKPLPIEPLAHLPRCVIALLQHMMEKHPDSRPQTPQDLQKAIAACIEEIRRSPPTPVEEVSGPFETLDLTSASRHLPGVGTFLAQNYQLLEELTETPQGRSFLADDLRRKRRVNILILSSDYVSDRKCITALEAAVQVARAAPHPLLREIHSLETVTDSTFLVQENVTGLTVLDILRARSVLEASEVVRLISLLAPLADHAKRQQLQYLNLTLSGIHLNDRLSTGTAVAAEPVKRPLDTWHPLEAKVDAIDFSFSPTHSETWVSPATLTSGVPADGAPGSYVRMLSLLAYELLGGPRARLDSSGHYTPVAKLNREGNDVLRRGVVDDYPSAGEFARQLAAGAIVRRPAAPPSESTRRIAPDPQKPAAASLPSPPAGIFEQAPPRPPEPRKRNRLPLFFIIGLTALLCLGVFLFFSHPQAQVVPELSIIAEPPGASILLDGKPPDIAPNTFTHVPAGTHQITAALDGHQPLRKDIKVQQGMAYQVHVQLKPLQEIAALSVLADPAGATILLDGKPPQVLPNTFTHVPFGTHQITAALVDYESVTQAIEVKRDMAPEIRIQLKPVQEIAALSVLTDPAGAEILLDGKPPENPPNTFTHVPFGTHQITANLADYEPLKQEIDVRRGMVPTVSLRLNPDRVATLVRRIKKYPEGSPQQVTAYVQLLPLLTTSGASTVGQYTNELTGILEGLRTKAPPISKDEFNLLYKYSVTEAAALNILPAILWLAENEKPDEAADLFLRAAKLGDSEAMMKLGRLYLRKGTPADDAEGFRWLNKAYSAPKPNLEAGAFIGDCYLSGKGTKQDVQKAEEIILPLANQSVVPAMTLAGRILQFRADLKRAEAAQNGSPQFQKNLKAQADELERQARRWWERAENNDWNASARLAKCYEEGWGGLEKNDEEAEKRYKAGASHGNALSLFFYGLFLEKKPERKGEAAKWIVQAAEMGLPSAAKWCNDNNVPFQEAKVED